MKWRLPEDNSSPIITAEKHIGSGHAIAESRLLPHTCVIFEIGIALRIIEESFETVTLYDRLPCFLDNPKCIAIKGNESVCFTRGGYGAPAATDTLETVRALGVKRIIVVGMCGGFSAALRVGDAVVPSKLLCEEGTSFHYYENIEYALPNAEMHEKTKAYFSKRFKVTDSAIVTSDSFYRQTYAKEAYWRSLGCVGVDMESSALLSVSRYYYMPAAAVLLCSDRHPLSEGGEEWQWGSVDFSKIKVAFVKTAVEFAASLPPV